MVDGNDFLKKEEMLKKEVDEVPEFLAGDHTFIRELLHTKNDGVRIHYSLAYASLPAGKSSLPHQLGSSEVYFILQGRGIVCIEEEQSEVRAGSMVFIPANATQYVKNTGTEVLKFLCIVSPEWKASEERIL